MSVPLGSGQRLAARHEASETQRKYVTRLARKPYRIRNKVTITKTPAEKEVLAEHRAERHEKMVDALAAARDTVSEEARKMQAEFGGHDEKYFQHQILQNSRLSITQRKTNRFNAFMKYELEKVNACE